MSQPFFLGTIIRYFSQPDFIGDVTQEACYWAVGGLCGTTIGIGLIRNHYFAYVERVGMNVQTSLGVLIYKKIMRLSSSAFETTSIGQILNIISNDFNRFEELSYVLYYTVVAPVQSALAIYLMWPYLGFACFGGIIVLFLYIPFQFLMGRFFRLFR